MSLLIAMMRPEGVFLSTDHRLTRAGVMCDDEAPKQLVMELSASASAFAEGGPRLLIGFVGLAQIADGTPMIQWVRETLTGVNGSALGVLDCLRERADRDIAGSKLWENGLVFGACIVEAGSPPLYAEVSNYAQGNWQTVNRKFTLWSKQLDDVYWVRLAGSGSSFISSDDVALMDSQAQIRPSHWQDHLGLLASINRRAAARANPKTVSPWCRVSMITGMDRAIFGRDFQEPGEPRIRGMETMIMGIDMTHVARALTDPTRDSPPTIEEIERGLRPRP